MIEELATIECPHCCVHLFICSPEVPSRADPLFQITVQVPEDYCPARRYACRFDGTSCQRESPRSGELGRPSGWDWHSGYLWFDTALSADLKTAFKELLVELGVAGWWELAEEIHAQRHLMSETRCEA